MSQAIFTAKTGIKAQQARLDIIGNNLANANTNGYKSVRADFKDALYQTLRRPVFPENGGEGAQTATAAQNGGAGVIAPLAYGQGAQDGIYSYGDDYRAFQDELNLETGVGTILGQTIRRFTVGSMQDTGQPLDVMLTGEGFFTVASPAGDIGYTRDGTFRLSNEADGMYLINGDGFYVLDEQGERIRLPMLVTDTDADGNTFTRPANLSQLSINADGYMNFGTDPPFARLGLRDFPHSSGLEAVGNSLFKETIASGEPQAVEEGVLVRQGFIEMSTTDLANEMVRMIRTQRAMQLSSRALTTADQMMGIAISARR
jgi:flagellar basal-body rod protein FlgG